MGRCEQTVSLATGKIEEPRPRRRRFAKTTERSYAGQTPPPPARQVAEPACNRTLLEETSGSCVVTGSGVTKAWEVRAGRFLATLGEQNQISGVSGFLGPETILANAWKDGQCRLSMIDVRTEQVVPTRIEAAVSSTRPERPTLHGPHGLAHGRRIGWNCTATRRTNRSSASRMTGQRWGRPAGRTRADTSCGRVLAAPRLPCSWSTRRMARSDQSNWTTCFRGTPRTTGGRHGYWSLDVDDEAGRMAVGAGRDPHTGSVAIVRLADKSVEMLMEGFPSWVTAVASSLGDRLLTATRDGLVQLWELRRREPLWRRSNAGAGFAVRLFAGQPPLLVCVNMLFSSASVLRLEDGALLRKTDSIPGGETGYACRGSTSTPN